MKPLTTRLRQVAELAAEGLTNKEIATALNVTESTVKHHLLKIFVRLGIRQRSEIVHKLAPPRIRSPLDWQRLGERERAVVLEFVREESPRSIARRLGCSFRTVFVYLWNARRTLGVKTNAGLGFYVGHYGLERKELASR
jgi:DNA-binding NarL/FixJ family response regulator